ncbi:hypothetical protein R6Z07F_005069 [Ovis aries]
MVRRRVWDPRTSEDVRPLRGVYWTDGGQVYILVGPWLYSRSRSSPTSASAVCPGCKFMLQNLSAEVWKPDPLGDGKPEAQREWNMPRDMAERGLTLRLWIAFRSRKRAGHAKGKRRNKLEEA